MRRRKNRLPLATQKALGFDVTGKLYDVQVKCENLILIGDLLCVVLVFLFFVFGELGNFSGSSDGPDPSSSDFSADTVIYVGKNDDATDGEHPPVYIPSMSSGDNRCSMNKALKGSTAEKPSKLPQKKTIKRKELAKFNVFSSKISYF